MKNILRSGSLTLTLFTVIVKIHSAAAIDNDFLGDDSLGEPGRRWEMKTIPVCWADDARVINQDSDHLQEASFVTHDISAQDRAGISSLIRENYSPKLTGIRLTGFEPCPSDRASLKKFPYRISNASIFLESKTKGIVIGVSSLGDENVDRPSFLHFFDWKFIRTRNGYFTVAYVPGRSYYSSSVFDLSRMRTYANIVGNNFAVTLSDYLPRRFFMKSKDKDRLEEAREKFYSDLRNYTVLHEVGHAFGLRHEQARLDTPTQNTQGGRYRFCKTFSGDFRQEKAMLPGERVSRLSTEYDLFSIMNYCRSDMALMAEKAKVICDWKSYFQSRDDLGGPLRDKFDHFLEKCDFVAANAFPSGLTPADRAGLRQMYLAIEPGPNDEVDFRESKTKMEWIEVLNRFYELPFSQQ